MSFITLSRFGDPGGRIFDVDAVLQRVHESFADVRIIPGDQLALSAERAAAAGAPEHVVRTLRRNQHAYGPAYAFEIDGNGTGVIHGRVRRYDVTFSFAEPLTDEWRRRLRAFLDSLGPGRIEEGTTTTHA